MNTQNRMVSLNDQSNKSSQSSRLSVSSVSVEDASKEEGPPDDDDSVLVALGLLGAWLTLLVVLQSSHQSLTALVQAEPEIL